MPLSILLIMSIGLVVGAALQCLAPLNFRPGIFFGVTVDPEFCRTEDAQRILWSYRRPIIVMTVLCIATLWLVVPRLGGPAAPIAASALVFLGVSVAIVSMARATRHVRAFAKPLSPIRTVSVISRKRTLPGGWLPLFGPMLIVGTARWLLLLKRESMPAEVYRFALALLLVPFATNAFGMWVAGWPLFECARSTPAVRQQMKKVLTDGLAIGCGWGSPISKPSYGLPWLWLSPESRRPPPARGSC
jgi:hypothetical protein